ncbi:VOC family protein [Holdemania massiliensis]|uniref:VOC family protein n=1 Tax=Holdemania massiliensis TaxID=1468449 RepID=UPI001F0537D7|nr:VOC family protein [Holdemania massiliensis]MCH1942035.1 VOC family protein [Holdemania massiliensis]
MKFTFNHFNFNVLNMQRSLEFYEQALGLHIARKHTAADGSFQLIYLEDDLGQFQLELTELKDRTEKYDLGECEFHLAFTTDHFEEAHRIHQEMGVICFENSGMGIYFIEDPDGYWIEIVPAKK